MKRLTSDTALLVLRIVAGAIFLPHGYSKVFGEGGVAAFAHDIPGYGIPAILGYIAAYSEFSGAILLIAGLLTRLDAFLLACTMAAAVLFVQLPDALRESSSGSIHIAPPGERPSSSRRERGVAAPEKSTAWRPCPDFCRDLRRSIY